LKASGQLDEKHAEVIYEELDNKIAELKLTSKVQETDL
jgi:hypothetical protein